MKPMYYYLHTNGELIGKNPFVVDKAGADVYFDSPFVANYWYVHNWLELNMMLDDLRDLRVANMGFLRGLEKELEDQLKKNPSCVSLAYDFEEIKK